MLIPLGLGSVGGKASAIKSLTSHISHFNNEDEHFCRILAKDGFHLVAGSFTPRFPNHYLKKANIMNKTKIIVIGGGPGGYVAAIRAAQLGGAVTLVEQANLGGTCLNVGCIPTKSLLHTAEVYQTAKDGADCGVISEVKLDFAKAQKHKEAIVQKLVGGVKGLLAANQVTVVSGTASFQDATHIQVVNEKGESQVLVADKIIIATGSAPMLPSIPGVESPQCLDSTDALNLKTIPQSLLIIGGGVIGVEIATIYSALGCKVTIVEMLPAILPLIDAEVTKLLAATLQRQGVAIYTSAQVKTITDSGRTAQVRVKPRDGQEIDLITEKVLVCVGRKVNTAGLNLSAAGIKADKGKIVVDDRMRTNVKGIYAIGDCTGGSMLAHVASVQGEIAAENALGHKHTFDLKTCPSCVYTNPEIAAVGLTEKQASEQGLEYTVGRFPLAANGKSLIMGGLGLIKLIAGKQYGEILGVQIIGLRATDLIAECALAIRMEATLDEFAATIHAHPTVSEAVREAALAAEGRAIHILNK
jgi:dihydrolipoamide dehydrogenase